MESAGMESASSFNSLEYVFTETLHSYPWHRETVTGDATGIRDEIKIRLEMVGQRRVDGNTGTPHRAFGERERKRQAIAPRLA